MRAGFYGHGVFTAWTQIRHFHYSDRGNAPRIGVFARTTEIVPDLNQLQLSNFANRLHNIALIFFDQWNKKCYLKRKISTHMIMNPHSVLGVRAEFPLPKDSPVASVINIRFNSRFTGDPIARRKDSNFDSCKAKCKPDRKCVAFSFLKYGDSANNCEIFNEAAQGYISESSADSGWKQQPP